MEKPILSFTSHKGRIGLIDDIFHSHVTNAEQLGARVCFSCQADVLPLMTDYQKSLIAMGKIEVLHVPTDYGSNTKWALCRTAYPDATMIVVDDDWTYDIEGLRSLLEEHERFPEAVICRAYRTIPWIGRGMPKYEVKPVYSFEKTVTAHRFFNPNKDKVGAETKVLGEGTAYPEHFLGVLYPPKFPNSSPQSIPKGCYKDDDIYIGACIAEEGRVLVFAGRAKTAEDREANLPQALWAESRRTNGRGGYEALKEVCGKYTKNLKGVGLGDVYVLTCSKYPNRRERIKAEMNRLGILFTEQYDNGQEYPEIGFRHKRINRCHLAKYLALKDFLQHGGERVTIIEDDVVFLKDMAQVSRAIATIPEGFGACRVNWAPSPYIRKELERQAAEKVAEIDSKFAQAGEGWLECPWGSCDGCTIITKEVAFELCSRLERLITSNAEGMTDNSDDMLCRACKDMQKPLYVYKPLLCIQRPITGHERGKSDVSKFFSAGFYKGTGIVLPISAYKIEEQEIRQSLADEPSYKGYTLTRRLSNKPRIGMSRVIGWD